MYDQTYENVIHRLKRIDINPGIEYQYPGVKEIYGPFDRNAMSQWQEQGFFGEGTQFRNADGEWRNYLWYVPSWTLVTYIGDSSTWSSKQQEFSSDLKTYLSIRYFLLDNDE